MCTRSLPKLFLVFWLMALLITGCNQSPADSSVNSSSDGAGQTQHNEQVEHRFAVFSPAIGVMLQELGFEDSIVGKHAFDTALGKSIPVLGTHLDIDYEMLLEQHPTDLFFERNTGGIPDKVTRFAQEHNWRIWTYKLETLDDIANAVDDLYLKLVGFESPETSGSLLGIDANPMAKFDVDLPSARLANAWSDRGAIARDAGRVLLLAGIDPPGALGPESFHGQLLTRMGATLAIDTGGMWQELDYEDLIELAPDSILIFAPKPRDAHQIGEPSPMGFEEVARQIGGLAGLDIPAVKHWRIAIIEHPLGLLPSTSLGEVADEIADALARWAALEE